MKELEGSSTAHWPTYDQVSPPTAVFFVASDGVHLLDQSSVNCSRKGALIEVGYEVCGVRTTGGEQSSQTRHTVKVGLAASLARALTAKTRAVIVTLRIVYEGPGQDGGRGMSCTDAASRGEIN